jgi:hypothetical protein
LKNWGICTTIAVLGTAATLLLYGMLLSLHQDLSGGMLNAKLSIMLGDDFKTYNAYFPPIESFWNTLALRLSALTGVDEITVLLMQTCLMVTISAALAFHIRQKTVGAGARFFCVSFLVLLLLPILFKNIFGLREHLVVLGMWPYLVLRAAGDAGKNIDYKLRVFLGLWMGFTLLFKFMCSLFVIFVELADAIAERRILNLFRIENLLSGAVVFIYLLLWLGLDPDQREAFSAVRDSISGNLISTAVALERVQYWFFISILILIFSGIATANRRLTSIGAALVLGAIAVAWMQERWYSHHVFPIFMALVGWWWLVGNRFNKWAHICMVLVLGYHLQYQLYHSLKYQVRTSFLERTLRDQGLSLAGQRVGLLNQHPSPYNQVILSSGGVRWTPQMNVAYISAALKPFDTPENTDVPPPPLRLDAGGENPLHDQHLGLWVDFPPDVLIIDNTTKWPLRHLKFDWHQVLSEDQRFQKIFAQYELKYEHDDWPVKFEYYVRND